MSEIFSSGTINRKRKKEKLEISELHCFVSTFWTVDSTVAWIASIQAAAVDMMTLFIIETLPAILGTILAKRPIITLWR